MKPFFYLTAFIIIYTNASAQTHQYAIPSVQKLYAQLQNGCSIKH